jgi:hypothetical protein
VCRLTAEEKKNDKEKKWACKSMMAHDSLEKRRRAQAREGLPLEASLSTEEEDDDEVMRGWRSAWASAPEVGPSPMLALADPSGAAVPTAQGPASSLSGAWASAEPTPIPALVEEAGCVEGEVAPLPEEAVGAPTGV